MLRALHANSINAALGRAVLTLPVGWHRPSIAMPLQLLAIIGEQFDVGNEICGAIMSVRYHEDSVALWNRNADNEGALMKIRSVYHYIYEAPLLSYHVHQHGPRFVNLACSSMSGRRPVMTCTPSMRTVQRLAGAYFGLADKHHARLHAPRRW